ncbi:MAG: FMN-binding glutamate synthase family protein [Micavibrio sp.]
MALPALFAGAVEIVNAVIIAAIGTAVAVGGAVAAIDRFQQKDALRHKFPVLARFVKIIDWVGDFWRSHGGAGDREEMPFNREQRKALARYGEKQPNVIGFGSSNNLRMPGTPIFINAAFPPANPGESPPLLIGPYCDKPYTATSIFNISAMSYGALSKGAVQALTAGAKKANCWLNTGEGGLAPAHLENGCDLIFQIGTAKFGVRDEQGNFSEDKLRDIAAHDQVKMIEIKLSQGAKPGKGGILPGVKVSEEIATIRGIPVGKDAISPAGHAEISSVSDLLDFIDRVRRISGKPVGFKAVISDPDFIADLCIEINKRGKASAPDFITVDGGEGGSGAAPMPLMDSVGLSIRESLPLLATTLVKYELKDRIRIIAAGKLVEASRVAWALAAGADFINSARGFMIGGLGCIQAKQCHNNTCPKGITTNNPELAERLNIEKQAEATANLAHGMRHDIDMIAHSCGVNHARLLRPRHVTIVMPDAQSKRLSDLYPALKF